MRSKNFLVQVLINLLNPIWVLGPKVKKRVVQEEIRLLKTVASIQFFAWAVVWIVFFLVNDQHKPNVSEWRAYRFSVVAAIALLAALAYALRKNVSAIRVALYALAGLMGTAYSWSTVLGQPLRSQWMVIFPTMVLMTVSSSFVFPAFFLGTLVYFCAPFWAPIEPKTWILTNAEVAIFILMLSHAVKRIWINTKVNGFLANDAAADNIEQREAFYRQISSFISPVLVQQIELETSNQTSFVAAVDSIMKRKKKKVAVLFSDLRNFSERSDDIDFVENELIPSAISIIDLAEKNLGVAKQLGDAVLIFYALPDPEEGLLRGLIDAFRCCRDEMVRVSRLGRSKPERFFTLTFGEALVGNMASVRHREATIIGRPANLASRIDALTKEEVLWPFIFKEPSILLSFDAGKTVLTFSKNFQMQRIRLSESGLKIRSYTNEEDIFVMPVSTRNIELIEELARVNELPMVKLSKVNHG